MIRKDGLLLALMLCVFSIYWLILLYAFYYVLALLLALIETGSIFVSIMALYAISIQFFGYGFGFLKSTVKLLGSERDIEKRFPELFFKLD